MRLSLILALAALHIALSSAADLPFIGNASLLMRGFITIDPCRNRFGSDRFKTFSSIKVDKSILKYNPPYCPACVADSPFTECPGKIELKITRRFEIPSVIRYPRLSISPQNVARGATCKTEQKPIYSLPMGGGRSLFIKAVKEMAAGAKSIAKFKCERYPARYKSNVMAEGFLAYLVHLAFEFNFSAI